MPALKIFQDIGELAGNGFGIEGENPVDDMVGAGLVGRPATASESRARTRSTIWLARVLSVALRSRGSVSGLNGRTITRAGSGRR